MYRNDIPSVALPERENKTNRRGKRKKKNTLSMNLTRLDFEFTTEHFYINTRVHVCIGLNIVLKELEDACVIRSAINTPHLT